MSRIGYADDCSILHTVDSTFVPTQEALDRLSTVRQFEAALEWMINSFVKNAPCLFRKNHTFIFTI